MSEFITIMIPFLGTSLGAAMVFFMKDTINPKTEKVLLGFAAGVMTAACVWSLLIPSIELSADKGVFSVVPASLGFLLGIGFLLLIDSLVPHLHLNDDTPEGVKSTFSKTKLMLFAVTIHNIPEGMAVGVTAAAAYSANEAVSVMSAAALSLGIAIQNFPEGAIVSMPLKGEGQSKKKAFILGVLSGAVEPIAAFITVLMTSKILTAMPYFLSFASGAMFYVVIEELIPESQSGKHSNIGTVGAAFGFVLMMILDTVLG